MQSALLEKAQLEESAFTRFVEAAAAHAAHCLMQSDRVVMAGQVFGLAKK